MVLLLMLRDNSTKPLSGSNVVVLESAKYVVVFFHSDLPPTSVIILGMSLWCMENHNLDCILVILSLF